MDGEFERGKSAVLRKLGRTETGYFSRRSQPSTVVLHSATQFSLQIELGARGEDLRLARQLLVQIENL